MINSNFLTKYELELSVFTFRIYHTKKKNPFSVIAYTCSLKYKITITYVIKEI